MIRSLFIIFLFLSLQNLNSQVLVPGGYVSGVWGESCLHYYINGNLVIHKDSLLVIKPGVQLIFTGHYRFDVYGCLLAEGTEEDTIVFTTSSNNVRWHGLKIHDITEPEQDSCKLVYCEFMRGKSEGGAITQGGGAIFLDTSNNVLIDHCLIRNNISNAGGGINIIRGSAIIQNSVIRGNSASSVGGGINLESSTVYIYNTDIANNYSNSGGGMSFSASTAFLENVKIISNTSKITGGGIECYASGGPKCKNVLIEKNSSGVAGGIFLRSSALKLENSTIRYNYGDYAGGIYLCEGANPTFSDSLRSNIYMNYSLRVQDIKADVNINPILHLDTFTVTQPDAFLANVNNLSFDINYGKVKVQTTEDVFVHPMGSNNNSGLSPEEPIKNIDYAIRKIIGDPNDPPTIHLAKGVYSTSNSNEYFPIYLKGNICLEGDNQYETIIDAEEQGNCIILFNKGTVTLKNMKITNGKGPVGGGIMSSGSNNTFEDLIISKNTSGDGGAGIGLTSGSNIKVAGCVFSENQLNRNISTSYAGGGGLLIANNSTLVESSIFDNNTSLSGGGAIMVLGNAQISNCLFFDNYAKYGGGAIKVHYYQAAITNCTFNNNLTINNKAGTAIHVFNGEVNLINNILWNDNYQNSQLIYINDVSWFSSSSLQVGFCDIKGGINSIHLSDSNITLNWLEGNIAMNPIFIDPLNNDYQLNLLSPCIDTGDPDTSSLNYPEKDLGGGYRIVNFRIDMGSYENQYAVSTSAHNPNNSLFIFPNPTSGQIQIKPKNNFNIKEVRVYDISGKFQATVSLDKNNYTDLSYLKAGLYLIKIKYDKGYHTEKVIIQ